MSDEPYPDWAFDDMNAALDAAVARAEAAEARVRVLEEEVAEIYTYWRTRAMAAERREWGAARALFPDPQLIDGQHYRDDSADYNLMGALHDLERQGADPVCVGTIRRVLGQIAEARAALLSTPAPVEMPGDVHPQEG